MGDVELVDPPAVKPAAPLEYKPDPAGGPHFTLPYRIDGREDAIDGWIKEGAIELRPRNGRWFFDGGDILRLDAPPTTRPTVYPPPAAE